MVLLADNTPFILPTNLIIDDTDEILYFMLSSEGSKVHSHAQKKQQGIFSGDNIYISSSRDTNGNVLVIWRVDLTGGLCEAKINLPENVSDTRLGQSFKHKSPKVLLNDFYVSDVTSNVPRLQISYLKNNYWEV